MRSVAIERGGDGVFLGIGMDVMVCGGNGKVFDEFDWMKGIGTGTGTERKNQRPTSTVDWMSRLFERVGSSIDQAVLIPMHKTLRALRLPVPE